MWQSLEFHPTEGGAPNSPFHPDPDTQGLPGFEGALAFRGPSQKKPGSGERGR
jgi:hypothetical protein